MVIENGVDEATNDPALADGLDVSSVPDGWHPEGIMAGVPDINAAAAQSTLGAVMTPAQIADVDRGNEGRDVDPGFDASPGFGGGFAGQDADPGFDAANQQPFFVAAADTGANRTDDSPQPPVGTAPAKPAGVDWHFITGHETTTGQGYVPPGSDKKTPDPNSGATIATGFDLSRHSADDLRGLGLPEDFIKQASPLLAQGGNGQTLKGQAAQDYLNAHPLSITPDQVQQIDSAVANHEYNQVAGKYNADQTTGTRFQDLPQEAQTAMISVAHQYGPNLADATPNFWNQVTSGQWQAAHDNLMHFGDDFKTRRHDEAGLLMNAINSGNLPAPPRQGN